MAKDREKIAKRRARRRRRRLKLSVKIFIVFFIIILSCGAYAGFMYYQSKHMPDPNGKLEEMQGTPDSNYDLTDEVMPDAKYWVINVGRGEAIYIKCEQTDILIDTGADKDAKAIIDEIKGEITGDLDYLIITSLSDRRTGGFGAICENLKPASIITCALGDKEKEMRKAAGDCDLKEGGTTTIALTKNSSLSLFKPEVSSKDPLDQSLLTLFRYGATAFFAESDAGEEEEARVIEQIDQCNALVLARGGSDQVNQHVNDISCSTYIASCDKNAKPSSALIENLKGSLFATYQSGSMHFTTNGKDVTSNLDQSKQLKAE